MSRFTTIISDVRSMMPWNLLRVIRDQQRQIDALEGDLACAAADFDDLKGEVKDLDECIDDNKVSEQDIEDTIEGYDFSDIVEKVIENYDFTQTVGSIIEDWEGMSDVVDEVLESKNFMQEIDTKVEDAVSQAVQEELLDELSRLMDEKGEDIIREKLREVLSSL